MQAFVTFGVFIIVVALLCYFANRLFTINRRCINCGDWCSRHDGVGMSEGFVCSECLYKTADPLPEEEDGQAEHAEAHYAAEEHKRQWEEFADTMHINGIPIEDWFVDTIDKEEKP